MSVGFVATGSLTRVTTPAFGAAYTICGWAKLSTIATWQAIFTVGDNVNNDKDWLSSINGSGFLLLEAEENLVGVISVQTARAITPVGVWVHLAMRRTGTTVLQAVQNGVQVLTGSGVVVRGTGNDLVLGENLAPGQNLNGSLREVRVWEASLTDAEILAEAKSPVPVRTTNLWGAWRLANNTDLADTSGNGRDLTAAGTVNSDADDPTYAFNFEFDSASEVERTGTTTPQTWTHTPYLKPVSISISAVHGTSTTDHITAASYGGVALTRKIRAIDSVTELGAAELWFLGSGIPTGAQTVSVTCGATTDDIHFVCIAFNGDGDTEVIDTDSLSADVANPSVTLQYGGSPCMAVAALYGGGAAPTSFTPNANCVTVHDFDLGAFYSEVIRQTVKGTADFAIGGTATSDDVAYAAMAVREVPRFKVPPRVRLQAVHRAASW